MLLVDDDKAFLTRLERAMEKRGFEVRSADSVAGGLSAVAVSPPAYAVVCLLYTSDAADERSSVDLGGRRIIKKKNDPVSRAGGPYKHEKTKKQMTICN